eukprot:363807-Chlamydomonas_euryale.AAC.4
MRHPSACTGAPGIGGAEELARPRVGSHVVYQGAGWHAECLCVECTCGERFGFDAALGVKARLRELVGTTVRSLLESVWQFVSWGTGRNVDVHVSADSPPPLDLTPHPPSPNQPPSLDLWCLVSVRWAEEGGRCGEDV